MATALYGDTRITSLICPFPDRITPSIWQSNDSQCFAVYKNVDSFWALINSDCCHCQILWKGYCTSRICKALGCFVLLYLLGHCHLS